MRKPEIRRSNYLRLYDNTLHKKPLSKKTGADLFILHTRLLKSNGSLPKSKEPDKSLIFKNHFFSATT